MPGRYQEGQQPDWTEILTYFRGSELQNYFLKIIEDNLKVPCLLIYIYSPFPF